MEGLQLIRFENELARRNRMLRGIIFLNLMIITLTMIVVIVSNHPRYTSLGDGYYIDQRTGIIHSAVKEYLQGPNYDEKAALEKTNN
jgi:hypothetical protein